MKMDFAFLTVAEFNDLFSISYDTTQYYHIFRQLKFV